MGYRMDGGPGTPYTRSPRRRCRGCDSHVNTMDVRRRVCPYCGRDPLLISGMDPCEECGEPVTTLTGHVNGVHPGCRSWGYLPVSR